MFGANVAVYSNLIVAGVRYRLSSLPIVGDVVDLPSYIVDDVFVADDVANFSSIVDDNYVVNGAVCLLFTVGGDAIVSRLLRSSKLPITPLSSSCVHPMRNLFCTLLLVPNSA